MKTPKLDEKTVGKWLSTLSDVALIDFFHAHVGERNIYRAEGRYREAHLVLGVSSRDRLDTGEAEAWRVQMLAPALDKWSADAPFCQFGTCSTCGSATASVARDATCPVCCDGVRGG